MEEVKLTSEQVEKMIMCKHNKFKVDAQIARLEDVEKFQLEIKVHCIECKMPFQFVGLKPGLNLVGSAMSFDGLQAFLAILPSDKIASPVQKMANKLHGFHLVNKN